MTRVLQSELLDTLPASDPAAARSRLDLRRVNWWMGHRRILTHALSATGEMDLQHIVELGAGDGSLALKLAAQLAPRWPNVGIRLVDRQPLVTGATLDGFRSCGWSAKAVPADVFEWLNHSFIGADLMFANLFLHHFTDDQLRELFKHAATRTRAFVALEPRRERRPLLGCRLLRLLGCNHVTRHDAQASVRAGFRAEELSALWPVDVPWQLTERSVGLFSHLFIARRESA